MNRPMLSRTVLMTGLSCAFAVSLSAAVASGGSLEEGVAAYQSGDYGRAFDILKWNAEQGDTKAQYLLGTLYRLGQGTERNEYTAFQWYKLAAEDGMLEAQYQVGMMYLQGVGVTASDDEALRWLWEAADRGYPQAGEVLEYVLYNDFTYGC